MFIRVNDTLILNTDRIVAVAVETDDATQDNVFAVYTDTQKFYILENDFDRLSTNLVIGV